MVGKVVKGIGGDFIVKGEDGALYVCSNRGKIALLGELVVGDNIQFSPKGEKGRIEKILPRKNKLERPNVANIDKMVVIIASEPKPDYYLVDKMLIVGKSLGLDVLICVNKSDLDESAYEYSRAVYSGMAEVLSVSVVTGQGIKELLRAMEGVCCLIGQSAVGKSSLLNSIAGYKESVGGLSRIKRGRNTTRKVEIFDIDDNVSIIDTCGFSSLNAADIRYDELHLYYDDYMALASSCSFNMCTHTKEPDCAVIKEVKEGRLDRARYERYLAIFDELYQKEKRKYD